jgi:hypothetical protein
MTTAIDTNTTTTNPNSFPGSVRLDSFEGRTALRLATAFGHEWAAYAAGCADFSEVRAAQWAGQDPSFPGIEPGLTHESGRGRLRWTITPERAVIRVCRPGGGAATIIVDAAEPDKWRTELGPAAGLVRHAVAAKWVIAALFGPERAEKAFVGLLGPRRAAAYAALQAQVAAHAVAGGEPSPEHWAEGQRLLDLRKEVEDYRLW